MFWQGQSREVKRSPDKSHSSWIFVGFVGSWYFSVCKLQLEHTMTRVLPKSKRATLKTPRQRLKLRSLLRKIIKKLLWEDVICFTCKALGLVRQKLLSGQQNKCSCCMAYCLRRSWRKSTNKIYKCFLKCKVYRGHPIQKHPNLQQTLVLKTDGGKNL